MVAFYGKMNGALHLNRYSIMYYFISLWLLLIFLCGLGNSWLKKKNALVCLSEFIFHLIITIAMQKTSPNVVVDGLCGTAI